MSKFHFEKDIPIEDGYDLVVAGGGPAGASAAICAARLGAKVLLVEATGCLGGMATSGLVTAFDPMANGKRMLVGGFMKEIVETMYERGYLKPGIHPDSWRKEFHVWTPFHPEKLKILLDELALNVGVEIRFFTRVVDADVNKEDCYVKGVILQNIEGFAYIRSKTFIDCTGDGVLGSLCGVKFREAGKDTHRIMPASLTSLFANIDWTRFDELKERDRYKLIEKAHKDGVLTQLDRHLPGMSRIGTTLGYLNGGHIFNLNALRCRSLTDGMILGRKIAAEYAQYYKRYIPGAEEIEHITTANLMGVRESRRLVGEYELSIDDYLSRREFPDQIGVFNKFVDIHAYDCTEKEYKRFLDSAFKVERLNEGEYFGIPYSILVPKDWKNLWVAGRCSSSDVKVHGSIRVQPAASMMGQAAGTAAVQSIHTRQPAHMLDTEMLIHTLRKNGAYLPQKQLCNEMTRI